MSKKASKETSTESSQITVSSKNTLACSTTLISVESAEGLCCPPLDAPLWQAHPRVYLDFNHKTETRCYYCGTIFKIDATKAKQDVHK